MYVNSVVIKQCYTKQRDYVIKSKAVYVQSDRDGGSAYA
jgi:hypothetical protein